MPVVEITPDGRTRLAGLFRDLSEYRELLYFLVWRDTKVRYKQTALGASWAVLQPLLLMLVFSVFLGRLARVPSDGLPYPVFTYAALVPWTLFASSLTGASQSLVSDQSLVTKVYFPRVIIPIASVGSFVVDFVISLAVLIVMMAIYGIVPGLALLWAPVFVALTLAAGLAVGIFFAAVNVRYRDVRYAVPFLVQLWLFSSPVAYPTSMVPDRLQVVYGLNPMSGVIEGFRWALLGKEAPDLGLLVVSSVLVILGLVGALAYFERTQRSFADEL